MSSVRQVSRASCVFVCRDTCLPGEFTNCMPSQWVKGLHAFTVGLSITCLSSGFTSYMPSPLIYQLHIFTVDELQAYLHRWSTSKWEFWVRATCGAGGTAWPHVGEILDHWSSFGWADARILVVNVCFLFRWLVTKIKQTMTLTVSNVIQGLKVFITWTAGTTVGSAGDGRWRYR